MVNPPRQFHNFISGCCAVDSAPALGAECPAFDSLHSNHISQENSILGQFSCVICSDILDLDDCCSAVVSGARKAAGT